MTLRFDPMGGTIVVRVGLYGAVRDTVARLALDTGANMSLVNSSILTNLGYDIEFTGRQVRIATASGMEIVPQLTINKIEAFGQERSGFPVLCHNLPRGTRVDGLLGLDFFRGQRLTIDFRAGLVTLQKQNSLTS